MKSVNKGKTLKMCPCGRKNERYHNILRNVDNPNLHRIIGSNLMSAYTGQIYTISTVFVKSKWFVYMAFINVEII